jgi:hypothetical protein
MQCRRLLPGHHHGLRRVRLHRWSQERDACAGSCPHQLWLILVLRARLLRLLTNGLAALSPSAVTRQRHVSLDRQPSARQPSAVSRQPSAVTEGRARDRPRQPRSPTAVADLGAPPRLDLKLCGHRATVASCHRGTQEARPDPGADLGGRRGRDDRPCAGALSR